MSDKELLICIHIYVSRLTEHFCSLVVHRGFAWVLTNSKPIRTILTSLPGKVSLGRFCFITGSIFGPLYEVCFPICF